MSSSYSRPLIPNVDSRCIKNYIQIQKIHPKAEFPYKENSNDVGYDITLISRSENRAEDSTCEVNNFCTGICICPPPGYYIEIVARSSLHKHGYMLATGTSIIDPGYTGEIIIPLYKYKDTEDLELPFRAVQMILHPLIQSHIQSVNSLNSTSRGDKGFGSTGNLPPHMINFDNTKDYTIGDINSNKQKSYNNQPPRNNHMF